MRHVAKSICSRPSPDEIREVPGVKCHQPDRSGIRRRAVSVIEHRMPSCRVFRYGRYRTKTASNDVRILCPARQSPRRVQLLHSMISSPLHHRSSTFTAARMASFHRPGILVVTRPASTANTFPTYVSVSWRPAVVLGINNNHSSLAGMPPRSTHLNLDKNAGNVADPEPARSRAFCRAGGGRQPGHIQVPYVIKTVGASADNSENTPSVATTSAEKHDPPAAWITHSSTQSRNVKRNANRYSRGNIGCSDSRVTFFCFLDTH